MIRDYPRLALVPGGLRVAGNPGAVARLAETPEGSEDGKEGIMVMKRKQGAPRGPETYVSEDGRFTVELSHGSTYPGNGHDLMGMWVGAGSLPKRLPSFINCVAEFKDDDGCWHRTFDDGAERIPFSCTAKLDPRTGRPTLDFDWMLEDTAENRARILAECERGEAVWELCSSVKDARGGGAPAPADVEAAAAVRNSGRVAPASPAPAEVRA